MVVQRRSRGVCQSATRITAQMLLSFLALSSSALVPAATALSGSVGSGAAQVPILPPGPLVPTDSTAPSKPDTATEEFSLKHIFHHGTHRHPNLHVRMDVPPEASLWRATLTGQQEPAAALRAKSRPLAIQRLSDRRIETVAPLLAAARSGGKVRTLSPSAWTVDEVAGPDITDKSTVIALAKIASDAYEIDSGTGQWEDVGGGWNVSADFGWQDDGLRGHVFANPQNSTVIVGLKGTSPAVFDGAETTTNDKINDNLFFSCCCAQGFGFWSKPCDCYTGTAYTCNQTCLATALNDENRYYRAALDLYSNVTSLYPDATIWFSGHSLGGAVSSLVGLTFGLPVTTFEAPAEALAAARIGLPSPPGAHAGAPQTRRQTGAYHFGHTADPIFMGSCNGATSVCYLGGYAMETQCHTGHQCVYDVVQDKGWRVGAGTHRIRLVINDVIEAYDEVAECREDLECVDCYQWKFFESNGTDSTTSSSSSSTSSKTRTRTSTCKTPGWWSCLDKSTTATTSATTSSTEVTTTSTEVTTTSTGVTTTTTATCKKYGWFGNCLDPITTTTTRAKTTPPPTITTTTPKQQSSTSTSTACKTPGFFGGCKDKTTSPGTTVQPTTTSCKTPGFFFGCKDDAAKTTPHEITSPPVAPTTTPWGPLRP